MDPNLVGVQLSYIKSLYYRLIARGAIIADHLHAEVTHIVKFEGAINTPERKKMVDVSKKT